VLKVDGRHAKRVSVRLGIRSGGWSEILDGLQAGDQVIPAAEGDIREGSRLRSAIKRRAA
jgi:HlyD family secretion protein